MLGVLEYIKARLGERSTWAAVCVGVTAAAALSWPWSAILAVCGVIGAIVPTSGKSDG